MLVVLQFIHSILPIVIFVLVLTFLILIHELGHFILARFFEVEIEEFGLGIPPKAKTMFHWNGIPITFNWFFLGGFVRMQGEDIAAADRDIKQNHPQIAKKKPEFGFSGGKNGLFAKLLFPPIAHFIAGFGNKEKQIGFPFYTRKLWQKILIVLAGPTVNILFGVIVFSTLFSLYGIPQTTHITPKVTAVSQNSPAQKAGILKNDQLLRIQTGDGKTKQDITDAKAMITFVNAHRGETLTMIIKREGNEITIPVYARKESEIPSGEGTIGIALTDTDNTMKFYPGIEQPVRGTIYGIQQSISFGGSILNALAGIGKSLGSGHVPSDISGPVGIAHEVQKEDLFSSGWATGFNFAALLSINLGVMNLLPIPALDGGRIFLLILEKFIKGKRFESISQNLNQFGFLFLMGLLLLITVKDVIGIFFSK